MSPFPQAMTGQALPEPVQPVRLDAFDLAMQQASARLGTGPEAIGHRLVGAISQFRAAEVAANAAVDRVLGSASGPDQALPPVPTGSETQAPPVAGGTGDAAGGVTGLILKTYDFAIEATLIGNAASTFGHSVNTLIKTQ